jgi:multiple sugar transport system substrate-binding protein
MEEKMSKKLYLFIFVTLALSMLLSACQPQTVVETVEVEKEKLVEVVKTVEVEVEKLVEVTAMPEAPKGDKTLIVWWSHWANEPAKRNFVEKVAADYEAENPDVDIVVTWWDKNPLRDAIRSTMTAGEGAPDITTFDTEMREWADAGWLMDLEDVLPWENFGPSFYNDGRYAGLDGVFKLNLSSAVDMLLVNPYIMDELGIELPEGRQFTQAEFLDVIKQCNAAGYAGVANSIGNRPHTGRRAIEDIMVPYVGIDQFGRWLRGEESVDTPEFRNILEYNVELAEAGMYPDVYATMGIDEYHVYFHTQQKACFLFNPTWYTGRSFKPVDQGGQDPNFQFKFMLPPLMDGAVAPNNVRSGVESGYAILSSTKHPEVAKDILAFIGQPKYGALWTALTDSPSAILYDAATDWPSTEELEALGVESGKWDWYWEEFNYVYGELAELVVTSESVSCGNYGDAWVQALNEGIPQGLLTVDEAIELLDSNLCQ